MKLCNNHSGLRGLSCFAEGIYWATGSSLTTPFTEGYPGANNKASPPGLHQEQAPKQRCTFSSTTFSSVQYHTMPYHAVLRWELRSVQGLGRQISVTDIYHTILYHTGLPGGYELSPAEGQLLLLARTSGTTPAHTPPSV